MYRRSTYSTTRKDAISCSLSRKDKYDVNDNHTNAHTAQRTNIYPANSPVLLYCIDLARRALRTNMRANRKIMITSFRGQNIHYWLKFYEKGTSPASQCRSQALYTSYCIITPKSKTSMKQQEL